MLDAAAVRYHNDHWSRWRDVEVCVCVSGGGGDETLDAAVVWAYSFSPARRFS